MLLKLHVLKIYTYSFVSLLILVSCGGGGGGGGDAAPVAPLPTVSFSANPSSQEINNNVTLTWSSSNASSCSASGGWSGSKGTSGSESVQITTVGNITFSISCSGTGGSRSASVNVEGYRVTDGVVVDGYISNAEVFIDENSNFSIDLGETTTSSDNDGKFSIKYSDGNLISLGGTDLDSQILLDNFLILHKMNGHSDFKTVTPVTSVAAFLCLNSGEECSGGGSGTDIKIILGIDDNIDIYTFDPVANKGDGGVNDFLYEKGNQLTILALALQNISNNLNNISETTQDYFKAIAQELDAEYASTTSRVDIETESFIRRVIENLISTKNITIDDNIKENTIVALAGVMPIISVKTNNDLTTAIIRFGVSTLQNDIVTIANGSVSEQILNSYKTNIIEYIAEDQNIDSNDITPDVIALDDSTSTDEDTEVTISVLANDSFITTAPISISGFSNGNNGSISLAESTQALIYSPNQDFNGTDSFTYTILQGDKSSTATVTVEISPINDAPSIDIASTIQTPENRTSIATISISDVDEDDLTLSMSGTDADVFNLSSDQVLSFKNAPDYETDKKSYGITFTLTDGEETVSKDVTINVTNVNDNSPIISSDSTFSVDENLVSIGQVIASDLDDDSLVYSISGSEIEISSSGALSFVNTNGADFETKSSYTAVVSVTDGVFISEQSIIVTVNDTNDNTPILTTTSLTPNENIATLGTITATDADANSSLSFSISGDDTLKDGSQYLEIDSSSGVISVTPGSSSLDYETKSSYSIDVTVSDGLNSSTKTLTISVQNILEDFIDHSYSISDGTISSAPVLTVNVTMDELSEVKKVYAELVNVALSPIIVNGLRVYPNCFGTVGVYEMTKNNSTSWSLTQVLSDELSDLCQYHVNFYVNFYDETVETAPPTDGIHLVSGNKRLHSNTLQYSDYYRTLSLYTAENTTSISNPRADSTKDGTDEQTPILVAGDASKKFYLWYPTEVYPEQCSADSYNLTLTDEIGIQENLTTPVIAEWTQECQDAMMTDISQDQDKVVYQLYIYSIEELSDVYAYIFSAQKDAATTSEARFKDNGGYTSREVDAKYANVFNNDKRKAYLLWEFDKAFLPETYGFTGGQYPLLYVNPIDESGINLGTISKILTVDSGGSDSDVTPPEIESVSISDYENLNNPDRSFAKFEVEFKNEAPSGSLTSIKDIWFSVYGGPRCDSKGLYVRDEMDGKISVSTSLATATIPFLKNNEGTYIIQNMNINDFGFAETYYGDSTLVSTPNSLIGTTFTVGDGSATTCPLFIGYPDYNTTVIVDEEQRLIGNFPVISGTSDTIVYSVESTGGSETLHEEVEINAATGELKFLTAPDADTNAGDVSGMDRGALILVATSGNNPNLSKSMRLAVKLRNLNDNAPSISTSSISGDENQTSIGCLSVSDPDYGPLPAPVPGSTSCSNPTEIIDSEDREAASYTYSVTGDNLTISNDGRLSFLEAPDYETISSYNATVTVSDGVFSTSKEIVVNVSDVNDNSPSITSDTTFTVDENQIGVGSITISDPDTVNSFTYTIDSDYQDGSLFSIDSSGVITFIAAPDFETKSVYKLRVNISDGAYTLTQIFTIILNDICDHDILIDASNYSSIYQYEDFKGTGTLQMREDYDLQISHGRDDIRENSQWFANIEFNSSDYDVCAAPDFTEIFDLSLSGPDADFFELSSSTANDFDTYQIYFQEKKMDYENPGDADQNNVYEFTVNSELGGVTETKDFAVTIKNVPEFGYIDSISLDEDNNNFLVTFITDHDLPEGTTFLRFNISGPSYASNSSERLSATTTYDSSISTYNLVIDGISGLAEGQSIIYGGYYQVYSLEALNSSNEVIGSRSLSRLNGKRIFYYERSDGNNYPKITEVSANLYYNNDTDRTIGEGTVSTSNSFVDYRSSDSQSLYLGLRLDFDSGFKGKTDEVWHQGDFSIIEPTSSGIATHNLNLSLSPYMRSGDHRYRIYMAYFGPSGSSVLHYIYWEDLLNLGLVDENSQIIFRNNNNASEDVVGPNFIGFGTPSIQNCVLNISNNEYTFDISNQVGFSDASIYTVSNELWANGEMGYRRYDSAGNFLQQITMYNYDGQNATDRSSFTVSASVTIDANNMSSSADYTLVPYYARFWDAAGITKLITEDTTENIYTRYYNQDLKNNIFPFQDYNLSDIDIRDFCSTVVSETDESLDGESQYDKFDQNLQDQRMLIDLEKDLWMEDF